MPLKVRPPPGSEHLAPVRDTRMPIKKVLPFPDLTASAVLTFSQTDPHLPMKKTLSMFLFEEPPSSLDLLHRRTATCPLLRSSGRN